MLSQIADVKRVIALRLNPGEDILLSLREAVRVHDVKNGFFLGGAGSASHYNAHVVETTNMPPGDIFFEEDGPFDILDVTGAIINGRIHAHIVLSNVSGAVGGHLEEGTRILTFAIVVIADTPSADLTDWDSLKVL